MAAKRVEPVFEIDNPNTPEETRKLLRQVLLDNALRLWRAEKPAGVPADMSADSSADTAADAAAPACSETAGDGAREK